MFSASVVAILAAVFLSGAVAACSNVQTSSGRDYVAGYTVDESDPETLRQIDEEIARAALVEPQLRFPARIGIARIEGGLLSPLSEQESAVWQAMAERLGEDFGSFVPVSPMVAALAMPADDEPKAQGCAYDRTGTCLAQLVRQIRLGAARQHIDSVLIYEAFADVDRTGNVLAFTKVALIGFMLPTEDVEAGGFANAMLVDVRNGYAYGTASAVSDDTAYRLTTWGDSKHAEAAAGSEARLAAVAALSMEVETMMHDLRLALDELPQP